jgi:hypothetical protein
MWGSRVFMLMVVVLACTTMPSQCKCRTSMWILIKILFLSSEIVTISPWRNTNMKAIWPERPYLHSGRTIDQMYSNKLEMCTCFTLPEPCPNNKCYCCNLLRDICAETPQQCGHGCAPGCKSRALKHPWASFAHLWFMMGNNIVTILKYKLRDVVLLCGWSLTFMICSSSVTVCAVFAEDD